ncbi:O-fucosyltransferase family protein isoform 1 [Tripterygium wilfordii]|uniref:O-fucosyltransferase family protein n=1 Tax=Tripterygium wilfordii TaxID=458696 RepID=A0A7J7DML6_TRIWF|nr:O-fucosyltransferase 39-like [Tripterygium wilfordii]XP_038702335.1 O-fucosyltransferase 39-like [Tripterygium wilfordii]XP_038702336.1 O-fucosyltransferase 39-like [Tripterygium wilfordii]XP_038702337.1 O-fucosyltransferase 39-like [Tripterygium wilfordii]XP_038702338.1 O-fucosyltransferase 39-like [Tripterygium wilfordii]KAF5747326.1 O-fucosyltransferase family protein isoform 1 [Tripterygium wilfordii]
MKVQHQRTGALSGLLVLFFPIFLPGLFSPLSHASPSMLSELNDPKPKHSSLMNSALQQQSSNEKQSDLWTPLADQGWRPCVESTNAPTTPQESQGYLQVFLDGGLNQQRMGICDAVAVAKILNATLVIPHLEVNPVWQDSSSFMDIFDVDHFIETLKDNITIVRELPDDLSWSTREFYAAAIRTTRIKTAPVHASANWYMENVLPVLQSYGIAAIAPFSHRLAFDNLPMDIQLLRCKVNFQALVFVPHIRALGDELVSRLRYPSNSGGALDTDHLRETTDAVAKQVPRKFVALHLRFDKDMAAHSACDFGGGKAEKLALAKYRQLIWQGRVLNSQFTDEELRSQGRCPLTPEEIGLLLAALGFDNTTRLYLASHKVYGGEARISTLRKLFPLMEDKKSLASSEERTRIKGKASLLAAVDYYVGMHSDIFISASPGNMHNALVGHRTFENLKTIRPNMALLGQLFLNKSISWSDFQKAVVEGHGNREGQIRLRNPKQSIYTYPASDCMCHVKG